MIKGECSKVKQYLIKHVFPTNWASWPRQQTRNSTPSKSLSNRTMLSFTQNLISWITLKREMKMTFTSDWCASHIIAMTCWCASYIIALTWTCSILDSSEQFSWFNMPNNMDELIIAVVESFNAMSHHKLNNVFVLLQQCLDAWLNFLALSSQLSWVVMTIL